MAREFGQRLNFKEKVWRATKKIPGGRVTTYQEIARSIGRPGAARAVGNALNKNPFCEVPCHRVIRSDGWVGGFARGIKEKIKLLQKEGVMIAKQKVKSLDKHGFGTKGNKRRHS